MEERRGGNAANSLMILLQYIRKHGHSSILGFISVFSGTQEQPSGMIQKLIEKVGNDVDMTNCVYRGKDVDDPTCWIVTTLESRTCISYTTIPELTANEYLANISRSLDNDAKKLRNWFHFEGRNLDQVLLIVDALRERYGSSILISIEFEKIRKGMDELLPKAGIKQSTINY